LQGLRRMLGTAEVVVDAVLGTGKARPIEGTLKEILAAVAEVKTKTPRLKILALDLPSGLDADSGKVDPAGLRADMTVTLGYPKVGLFSFPGAQMVGELVVAGIGIPPRLGEAITLELMTRPWVRSLLPHRPYDAHKGTFGRVLAVVGSTKYIGAAYLACQGAARIGAGLVTLACTTSLQPILASKMAEVTYLPLPESAAGVHNPDGACLVESQFVAIQALLVGCGLGQEPPTMDFVHALLLNAASDLPPTVIDADGLNALSQHPEWWKRLNDQVVITPHPGEMARLMDLSNQEVQSDRLGVARRAAECWGKVVVLKGAHTVVARPDGWAKLSPFANPGLASAGTGDVLAGAIAGLLAQGLSPWEAAACGVYLHGVAGEMAKKEMGDTGLLASDLLPLLPKAIKELKEV
ncbi:MAG: NAD(P)H-hydrate dehydratase, partial [Dehalococcoidia bacterium]